MSFQFDTINLASLLAQSVASNQPFARNLDTNIVLENIATDLYVSADSTRLEQVMSNMLSNAAKFSDPGETVTVRAIPKDDKVRIEVIDRGIGLAEKHRSKVFEEFSQLDSSDRRKVGGTGLGLNISKRIMDAHAGVLDYSKNEGAGTTFYIDLSLVNNVSDDTKADTLTENEAIALSA